ncbi:uncharacterized protein TNCV_1860631 [Trichonephila clavipes]|nr:uncharacterized protein TNCV_1860631 [Trichonephila clavipes]
MARGLRLSLAIASSTWKLNSVSQQPMKAKDYYAHISIRDLGSAKEQKLQDSKCNREFQIWWTEKHGIIRKGDKEVCILYSGIVGNVDDRAKLASFLATLWATWLLIERRRSGYAVALPETPKNIWVERNFEADSWYISYPLSDELLKEKKPIAGTIKEGTVHLEFIPEGNTASKELYVDILRFFVSQSDSQKLLRQETKEYFKTDQNLTNVQSINTDLASDRTLLESRKNQLLKRLKENNVNFKRINNVHKRIQNRIEKEKRRGEDNSKRYKEELNKLQTTLNADNETFEIFKQNLLNRELLIDDVKSLLTDGIKNYINRDQKEEESEVSYATEETDISETTSQSQVSTEANSGKKENEAETEALVEKKPAKKKAPEKSTPIENELSVELRKRKLLHQIAQEENVLLSKYYQYLNSRMKNMNEMYMEHSYYHNFKKSELRSNMMKASDLYQLVMRKIRRYVIPPRNKAVELKMSIESRKNENDRLRDFIAQYVTYLEQDLEFDASFKDDAKEFYKNLLPQEAPEIEILEVSR